MYTSSYVTNEIASMKAAGTSKADIIRATAEMRLGWQYVYASQGHDCTPQWRRSRIPYCPSEKYVTMINENCPVLSGKQPACDGCGYVDTDVFDCAGFVLNEMQLAGVPFYGQGATTQWNTASNWAVEGEIKNMPKNLVCVIYKRKDDKMSHTGLSMGDGAGGVIHCSTFVKRGNVNTDRPAWTHWGIPKGLYTTDELRKAGIDVQDDSNIPTLRRGSQGDEVADLQMLLNSKFGYELEVDGNFGSKTEAAVKDFQRKHGLTADGVVGAKTWKVLGVSPQIVNPPADNSGNESQQHENPPTICIPYADWLEIKAAISAAYHVVKKYEGVE